MKVKKKKIAALIVSLAIVFGTGSFIMRQYSDASALSEARSAASSHVPSQAYLESEVKNEDEFIFSFFDSANNETYFVYVDRKDYTQMRLSSQVDNVGGSTQIIYSRDDMLALVRDHFPDARIQSVSLTEDAEGFLYDILFSSETVRGQLTVNPETGVIIERSLRMGQSMMVISLDGDDDDYVVPVSPNYLSLEEARLIALEKAPDTRITEIEYDEQDGHLTIEIEMKRDDAEYELTLDAQTGQILKFEVDRKSQDLTPAPSVSKTTSDADSDTTHEETTSTKATVSETTQARAAKTTSTTQRQSPSLIGSTRVKQIVLEKIPGATIIELELERDDGRFYYEGEAIDDRYEYEFTFDAYTGALIEWERDKHDDDDYKNRDSFIGTDAVKKIVLQYVPGATIIELELDDDDGRYYYEVEAKKDGLEYEFEIDAVTGTVIEWEMDD